MNNKDKKVILSLYNSNNNENRILLTKKKSTPHNFFPPMKIINISNNPLYLKNKDIKHTVSIKKNKCNRTPDSTLVTINQTTHNLSNTNFLNNNNNNSSNKDIYNYNDVNEINTPTIHANGKFKQLKSKIRKRLFDKKLIVKNDFFNDTLNKHFLLQLHYENKNKNNDKDNWKGLNISSHYIGNTTDNKFGITSNQLYLNNNLVLTCSQSNLKIRKKYESPIINDKKKKNEFQTINIPNHNIYYNGINTTNFFPRIENIVNNEHLYKKLMNQMTTVFNNKIKEYSTYKSNEKNNTKSTLDMNIFRKKLKNMRKQKIFNENKHVLEINEINLSPLLIDRNDSVLKEINKNKNKNKTHQPAKIRFKTYDVKRSML